MAPVTLTIARVDRTPTGGFEIYDPSGNGRSFADLAELQSFAGQDMDPSVMWQIALSHWLGKSANASDDSLIEGKAFVFDTAQNLAILQVS